MTPKEFDTALKGAKVGDEIVYHRGFHMEDDRALAHHVMGYYEKGRVQLYQRRVAEFDLKYCAKRVR